LKDGNDGKDRNEGHSAAPTGLEKHRHRDPRASALGYR
jgi:hypothetical protein